MAFIQHTNCPKCGSRDNLAEYTDGSYCFGCGYTKNKNDLESIRQRLTPSVDKDKDQSKLVTVKDIPTKPLQWLLQYGLTSKDAEEFNITWEPTKDLLVLVNQDDYWQGRNFGYGPKYSSRGNKPLIFYGNTDTLVCVEDVLSAIKIHKSDRSYTTLPLLGSIIPLKLTEMGLKRFKKIFIWLDRDKATEAVKQARNLKQKGHDVDVIITPNDPKEYNTGEIIQWLRNK